MDIHTKCYVKRAALRIYVLEQILKLVSASKKEFSIKLLISDFEHISRDDLVRSIGDLSKVIPIYAQFDTQNNFEMHYRVSRIPTIDQIVEGINLARTDRNGTLTTWVPEDCK